MNLEESLEGVTLLFLDSAPVIYFVEQNPQYFLFVRSVFERIQNGLVLGVTSPVTLAECLVHPYRLGQIRLQQNFINLLLGSNNMIFESVPDSSIAIGAAQIRAKYNLQLLDAFQIAVALAAGCEAFLTNDVIFRRITELQVLVLNDFDIAE
ncbi:twitching motility protein PilT [Scytonema hofmannii PCC 7110]|uniref:Twitching motility protein PilT n=1 Tax=Scytonema hofmannii PCC 7110 TaxID=128403 RepID=A0A139X435_9CYAN|nr:PIN domain-containing protein [Scytonema hofmannii]KYC39471.1 twitching motility protein PilT [Scytonema hofmannii PCC 7110]